MILYIKKYQTGGNFGVKKPFFSSKYNHFRQSLPSNLAPKSPDYDLKYLWKNNGKPKDFYEAQGWDPTLTPQENKNKDIENLETGNNRPGLFGLVKHENEEGMTPGQVDYVYHGTSVEPNTLRFLKAKNHPSVNMEIDWYKSQDPEAVKFRNDYLLKEANIFQKYHKYIPRK